MRISVLHILSNGLPQRLYGSTLPSYVYTVLFPHSFTNVCHQTYWYHHVPRSLRVSWTFFLGLVTCLCQCWALYVPGKHSTNWGVSPPSPLMFGTICSFFPVNYISLPSFSSNVGPYRSKFFESGIRACYEFSSILCLRTLKKQNN